MTLTSSIAASLLLSTNLLLANASPRELLGRCAHLNVASVAEPAQSSRTLQLDELGIEIEIPENFRAMKRSADAVLVLPPEDYDYLSCMMENRVPTAPSVLDVLIYQTEPASEALIRSQAGGRFGTRFIREEVVAGQPAFIYTAGGMTNDFVVRINYPDQQASLIVSAEIKGNNQVPMQETMTRILSSLQFQ